MLALRLSLVACHSFFHSSLSHLLVAVLAVSYVVESSVDSYLFSFVGRAIVHTGPLGYHHPEHNPPNTPAPPSLILLIHLCSNIILTNLEECFAQSFADVLLCISFT